MIPLRVMNKKQKTNMKQTEKRKKTLKIGSIPFLGQKKKYKYKYHIAAWSFRSHQLKQEMASALLIIVWFNLLR